MKRSKTLITALAVICIAAFFPTIFFSGCSSDEKKNDENENVYVCNGHISELEYPLSENMLENASKRFEYIKSTYLTNENMNIYLSIVPDKNYFLAESNGYPALDYGKLVSLIRENTDGYMEYIDIFGLLSLDDYYKTDSHWRQENIKKVADHIAGAMGFSLTEKYSQNTIEDPFYGIYYDRTDEKVEPDTIIYLNNDMLDSCKVTSYSTGKPTKAYVYDMEKAEGKYSYSIFLSGPDPLLVLENPNSASDRELIVFRDSFASSLVPLLAEAYSKITLIDTRYMQSEQLGDYVEFKDQDVLFLYSTLLLNNSIALK